VVCAITPTTRCIGSATALQKKKIEREQKIREGTYNAPSWTFDKPRAGNTRPEANNYTQRVIVLTMTQRLPGWQCQTMKEMQT